MRLGQPVQVVVERREERAPRLDVPAVRPGHQRSKGVVGGCGHAATWAMLPPGRRAAAATATSASMSRPVHPRRRARRRRTRGRAPARPAATRRARRGCWCRGSPARTPRARPAACASVRGSRRLGNAGRRRTVAQRAGVARRSAGLMCSSDGSSRRTASQNSASPGASTTSPHTVIASCPPGASHDHARPEQAGHVVEEEEAEHRHHRVERAGANVSASTSPTSKRACVEPGGRRRARACVDERRREVHAEHRSRRADQRARPAAPTRRCRSTDRAPAPRPEPQPVHRPPPVLVPERQPVEVIGRRRVRGDHYGPCRSSPTAAS